MKIKGYAAWLRKGIIAGVGGVGELVSLGVLHGAELRWAVAILAVATAAGVTAVSNAPAPAPPAPPAAG